MVRAIADDIMVARMKKLSAKVIQKYTDKVKRVILYGTRAGLPFSMC